MTESELEKAVREHYSSVYGVALCSCKNPSDAFDIAQEVFLKLLLCDTSFESTEHLKAWLLRCAINKSTDLLRSHWHKFSQPLESISERTTDPLEKSGENRLIPILMKVSRKCRAVLYLHYFEEYTVTDIARILCVSESAVRARLTRGKEQLRKLLENERKM